ncbi:MAG: hypothetical protein J5705_07795, partial [Bacteroidaceae bacterium]|nr:hypothetical protein [Bacteroidaceae bacterium]
MDRIFRTLTLVLALTPMQGIQAQEIITDSTVVYMDSTAVCTDSLTVEFPESMEFDVDSLMGLWFAKQYLMYDSDCIEGSVNPKFSDTVYAE